MQTSFMIGVKCRFRIQLGVLPWLRILVTTRFMQKTAGFTYKPERHRKYTLLLLSTVLII